jgi:uncharacterized phage protein (TIGR02220 family)
MSVFKNKKRVNPYSQIDNLMINDRRLPLECIGLMTYLLSKPEDWTISMQQLQSHFDIGREKMQRLTKILESAGYLIRMKPQNEQGQFIGTYWHVTDEPTDGNTDYRKTRQSENPTVGKPDSQYNNKENSTNKEYSNNKEKEKETSALAPSASISENNDSVVKKNFTTESESELQHHSEEKKEKKGPSIGRGAVTTEMPKVNEVIDYMNLVGGAKFRANTGNTAKMVIARYKEGYTIDDFKKVIDSRFKAWNGTEMMQHFCPQTLFRPNNFEKYLQNAKFARPQASGGIGAGSDYSNWDESKKPF